MTSALSGTSWVTVGRTSVRLKWDFNRMNHPKEGSIDVLEAVLSELFHAVMRRRGCLLRQAPGGPSGASEGSSHVGWLSGGCPNGQVVIKKNLERRMRAIVDGSKNTWFAWCAPQATRKTGGSEPRIFVAACGASFCGFTMAREHRTKHNQGRGATDDAMAVCQNSVLLLWCINAMSVEGMEGCAAAGMLLLASNDAAGDNNMTSASANATAASGSGSGGAEEEEEGVSSLSKTELEKWLDIKKKHIDVEQSIALAGEGEPEAECMKGKTSRLKSIAGCNAKAPRA